MEKIHTFTIIALFLFSTLTPVDTGAATGSVTEPQMQVQKDINEELKKSAELINANSLEEAESMLLKLVSATPSDERVIFQLGRLYKKRGDFEKAEEFLLRSALSYALLRDYALSYLMEIYLTSERYDMVLEISRKIKNEILVQGARQAEISALLAMNKINEAVAVLSRYIKKYPQDWEAKFNLATLLKNNIDLKRSVRILKIITT